MNILLRAAIHSILLGSILTACSGGGGSNDAIASSSSNDVAIDSYDKTFQFDVPEPCELFVVRRAAALDTHLVEYDVRVDDRALAVIYKMVPGDPLPIEARVTGDAGATIVSLRMSDAALSVRDSSDTEVLGVGGYLQSAPRLATGSGRFDGGPLVALGLRALACLLPAQTALGFVPDMFVNRAGGQRTGDGVSGRTADAPALVEWNASVTLLGAMWIAARGVVASSDGANVSWSPTCVSARSALIGTAALPCGTAVGARSKAVAP